MNKTILIVDDEPAFQDIIQAFFTHRGYTVLSVGNGEEARRLCAIYEGTIHLMIIDLVLPDEDGIHLTTALQSMRPESRVLFVSAGRRQYLLDRGILQSDDAFLEKPFTLVNLEKVISDLLR